MHLPSESYQSFSGIVYKELGCAAYMHCRGLLSNRDYKPFKPENIYIFFRSLSSTVELNKAVLNLYFLKVPL